MKYNLAEAVLIISANNFMPPSFIKSIIFEDGSERKFNYNLGGKANYFAEISANGEVIRNTYRNPIVLTLDIAERQTCKNGLTR